MTQLPRAPAGSLPISTRFQFWTCPQRKPIQLAVAVFGSSSLVSAASNSCASFLVLTFASWLVLFLTLLLLLLALIRSGAPLAPAVWSRLQEWRAAKFAKEQEVGLCQMLCDCVCLLHCVDRTTFACPDADLLHAACLPRSAFSCLNHLCIRSRSCTWRATRRPRRSGTWPRSVIFAAWPSCAPASAWFWVVVRSFLCPRGGGGS